MQVTAHASRNIASANSSETTPEGPATTPCVTSISHRFDSKQSWKCTLILRADQLLFIVLC
jgi:hypothetical protein